MKITKILSRIILVTASAFVVTSCTNDFSDLNTNPKSIPEIDPLTLLYTAEIETLTASHCWNGIYASKHRWMQYGTGIWNYGTVQYTYFATAIGNTIYNEYNTMGSYVTNIHHLCDNHDNAAAYSDLKQVARILLIAKGIQTSDLFGSLAYSEAWLARKGYIDDESLSPGFETQEELADVWDTQLKECITKLKENLGSTTQIALGGNDRAYNGDTEKWIKAANGLRLRLASRLWKRKPEVAKSIATEVLAPANAEYVFSDNDDSFILWFDKLYTNIHTGDWHSVRDMEIATYAIMDYLTRNEDPRKKVFFYRNNLTPENIAAYNALPDNAARQIPVGTTRWEGSTAVYDKLANDVNRLSRSLKLSDGTSVNMRIANYPQARLWKGNDNDGNGGNWAPIMTYADFCLLSAEFVLRENIASSKTAQEWYEDGVEASIDLWDFLGTYCDVLYYEAMTDAEKTAFLTQPDIAWAGTQAEQLEQIYAQTYIEHYKNADEAWAFWKRTGYPNTTSTIIQFEQPVISGVNGYIPRRVTFSYPNEGVHNYDNLKVRLDKMRENPEFGDMNDPHGRHWWDKE